MIAVISTQAQLPGDNALVLLPEAYYVRETETGLVFRPDTPIEVWGALMERLVRQEKRIQWAIGDAINFAEQAYDGHKYEQWVEQTGLSENTLSTMRWVAERIDPLRRRKDVGWSHHREVAALPADVQDRLLDRAEDKGLTRWDVRKAAQVEREKLGGSAETVDGTALDEPALAWRPTKDDLTDDARAALESKLAEVGKSYRVGVEAGFIWALVFTEARDCFREWKN